MSEFEQMLQELYFLVLMECHGESLTKEQSERYIFIYDTLTENGIDIPFGVEI